MPAIAGGTRRRPGDLQRGNGAGGSPGRAQGTDNAMTDRNAMTARPTRLRGRGYLTLLLLPALAACQPHGQSAATGQSAAGQSSANQSSASQSAAAPATAAAAGPAPSGDAQSVIDANERAIADNRRMAQTLVDYRRTDSGKLDRITADCEQKLGAASDRDSAKRIFGCVTAAW